MSSAEVGHFNHLAQREQELELRALRHSHHVYRHEHVSLLEVVDEPRNFVKPALARPSLSAPVGNKHNLYAVAPVGSRRW